MANSKLLKEAIADAKAVKDTALANAKLALEEAFTPRLQSMLTQKLRAEAEMESDEEQVDEELDSTGIGSSTSTPSLKAGTEFEAGSTKTTSKDAGSQVGDYNKVADINEEDEMDYESDTETEIAELKARLAELEGDGDMEDDGMEMDDMEDDDMEMDDMEMDDMEMDDMDMGDDEEYDTTGDEDTEDDMDLESIIKELEAQLGDGEGSEDDMDSYDSEMDEMDGSDEYGADEADDDEIDLEEILREMESDMKGGDDMEYGDTESEKDAELEEAYKTIKSLQGTINEVNLLNAKLLFANKLFRAHNMTNEQKVKVIETMDRTKSVREVKLVFSTLAENFKYATTTNKSTKKSISEGIASKTIKSTAPKVAKQLIAESTNVSDRFKKLAGIIK
jgi:hypothetical protein